MYKITMFKPDLTNIIKTGKPYENKYGTSSFTDNFYLNGEIISHIQEKFNKKTFGFRVKKTSHVLTLQYDTFIKFYKENDGVDNIVYITLKNDDQFKKLEKLRLNENLDLKVCIKTFIRNGDFETFDYLILCI